MSPNNANTTTEEKNDLDIRDILNYLLGRIWIVILAVICATVVAVIITSTIVPMYQSQATLFITNSNDSSVSNSIAGNFTIGKQLAVTSPELVTLDFCNDVADVFNAEYEGVHPKLDGATILSYIKTTSNEDTCIVTFTAETPSRELSRDLVNVVTKEFEDHIISIMNIDTIRTSIASSGVLATSDCNVHRERNAVIAAIVGAVIACAALVIAFMFDDKIKTPDDIDRYLKLNVLGVIPEIDVEG